jgi:hypothetical protein
LSESGGGSWFQAIQGSGHAGAKPYKMTSVVAAWRRTWRTAARNIGPLGIAEPRQMPFRLARVAQVKREDIEAQIHQVVVEPGACPNRTGAGSCPGRAPRTIVLIAWSAFMNQP